MVSSSAIARASGRDRASRSGAPTRLARRTRDASGSGNGARPTPPARTSTSRNATVLHVQARYGTAPPSRACPIHQSAPLRRRFGIGAHAPKSLGQELVTCNTWGVSVKDRVKAHRERMRAQGLRPIQIWVPDVRSPEFAAEAHRQSALVASAASDDMEFVESISSDWDE